MDVAASEVFVLGFVLGLMALPLSAYAGISPRWLRWSLLACAALMAVRYGVTAMSLAQGEPHLWWGARRMWPVYLIGLTWPAVVAADQLIRHPGVTPRTLARWYAPFAVLSLGVIVFGRIGLVPHGDRVRLDVIEGSARISGGLLVAFAAVLAFIGGGIRKRLPAGAVKSSLLVLMAAYIVIGLYGCVLLLRASSPPWLWVEALVWVAIWGAFQTAQRASS